MSETVFLLWRGPKVTPSGDHWQLRAAPWNDGEGGPYEDLAIDSGGKEIPEGYSRAEVLRDGDYCLLVQADPISPAEVTVKGKPGQLQLLVNGEPQTLEGAHSDWLNSLRGWLGCHGGRLVWLMDGGRDGWFDQRRQKEQRKRQGEAKKRRREQEQQMQQKHDDGGYFINPYTFVPLPPSVPREKPSGHAQLAPGHVSGWFDWTLTLQTQLLLWQEQTEPVTDLTYPGSSLRGVLRSLHETLTGSCLRVVDTDYTPVHREPMTAFKPKQDRLAVVEEVNSAGRVTKVRVCDRVVWVDVKNLENLGKPYSGMRITVDTRGTTTMMDRTEQRNLGRVHQGGDWVLHLTDGGTRTKRGRYFAATGEIGEKSENVVQIPAEVWQRYQDACDGGAGGAAVRKDRDSAGHPPHDTSKTIPGEEGWPGEKASYRYQDGSTLEVGRYRRADGFLAKGDTVWLTGDGELKMAAIWRRHGTDPVSERLVKSLAPCHDPGSLCPSCQVFGSVDPQTGAGSQSGYASHVRVGPGMADPVISRKIDLPPLRSPHPSAGGMYLRHDGLDPKRMQASKDQSHIPQAHWGSKADQGRPRPIAGRKYYWHGQESDDPQHGRHTVRLTPEDQKGQAVAVAAGTVLTARVYFDNLSLDQLAMLLAAADPARALGGGPYQIHLGRGKPLGYGSATTKVSALVAQTAAQRYQGDTGEPVSLDALADRSAQLGNDKRLEATWEALRRVLAPDTVPADRIWYPPAENFRQRDQVKTEGNCRYYPFDRSFTWFAQHSGGRCGDLEPLLDPRCPIQYLPIGQDQDKSGEDEKKRKGRK